MEVILMYFNTIEQRFEYQVKEILESFKEEIAYKNEDFKDLADACWKNRETLGTIFYDKLWEYFGEEIFKEESDSNE
jgi:hypothetical protein